MVHVNYFYIVCMIAISEQVYKLRLVHLSYKFYVYRCGTAYMELKSWIYPCTTATNKSIFQTNTHLYII